MSATLEQATVRQLVALLHDATEFHDDAFAAAVRAEIERRADREQQRMREWLEVRRA